MKNLVLLLAMCLLPAAGFAQKSGTTGSLEWALDNGTLTISGTGEIPNYGFAGSPWYDSCQRITDIVIDEGVTRIGEWAFNACINLTSVSIPNSMTWFGACAFYGCSSLTSVNIPANVIWIGEGAFNACCSLTSVNIPASVTEIGSGAFYGCSSLEDITVEDGNRTYSSTDGVLFNKLKTVLIRYPEGKTQRSYYIPSSVTWISIDAFYSSRLTSVNIPGSVTSIGGEAFMNCCRLRSVTLPGSVTRIDSYTFAGCCRLRSVTIPGSVTSIGNEAFAGCSSLASVSLPGSVTSIGNDAFNGCGSLTDVTVEWPKPLPLAGGNPFGDVKLANGTLHVRAGTKALYKAAEVWKEFGTFADPAPEVSTLLLDFASGGGTQDFTVTADVYWMASSSEAWATVSTTSGSADATIRVTTEANPDTAARRATITVRGGGITHAVAVTQDGVEPPSGVGIVETAKVTYSTEGLLSVNTPISEPIEVYSAGGLLLYKAHKAAGEAVFDLKGLSGGVLIVKGLGWTKKIFSIFN
jgi:hypothetical protein